LTINTETTEIFTGLHGESGRPSKPDRKAKTSWSETRFFLRSYTTAYYSLRLQL